MPTYVTRLIATLVFSTLLLSSAIAQPTTVARPELKAGDRWSVEERDPYSSAIRRTYEEEVAAVGQDRVEVTYDGRIGGVMSPNLTLLDNYRFTYDNGYQLLKFPIDIGTRWSFKTKWANKETGSSGTAEFDVEALAAEKVTVPAGTFDAVRLRAKGYMYAGGTWVVTITYWYAPAVKRIVRQEWRDTKRDLDYNRFLTSFKLSE